MAKVKIRIPEKTLLIVSIAVSVVLVGSFSALCYMKWKAVEKVRQECDVLTRKANELQKKINKLGEKEEERDRLAEKIHEYEKILPDAKEVENLMTMLSEQGRRSDCDVRDFSLVEKRGGGRGRSTGGGTYEKVKFECSISSKKPGKGYYSACRFLNLLERYERFIAVDEFSMSGGRGSDISMGMDISAHTYMFTGKKVVEKPAAGGRGARGGRGGRGR